MRNFILTITVLLLTTLTASAQDTQGFLFDHVQDRFDTEVYLYTSNDANGEPTFQIGLKQEKARCLPTKFEADLVDESYDGKGGFSLNYELTEQVTLGCSYSLEEVGTGSSVVLRFRVNEISGKEEFTGHIDGYNFFVIKK